MARAKKIEGLSVSWERRGAYPIRFAEDAFAEDNETVVSTLRAVTGVENPRVLLVADGNVVQRTNGLGTRIGKYVQSHGLQLAAPPIVLGGGEKIKSDNMKSVTDVLNSVIDAKVGATDVMLVLGGGSLLDVAGYAAAQVRGGLRLVRMPTTVASMMDAALATDAAIDSPNVKDALRVPCQPAAVIIDPKFATTVLDGVWRGGVGEAVRFAAVHDGALMKKLAKSAEQIKNRDYATMCEIVRAVVESRVKKGSDGFALWSAGRLEAMSGYKLPHGYAVPIGICIDCAYAVAKGYLKDADQELVCRTLADCGSLDGLVHSRHLLSQPDSILFGLDAWRLASGAEALVLPSGIGKSTVDEAPDREALKKVIKEFLQASTES